ncbi:hypothetical protein M378DRAFT_550596 [Amanita muscaria Koide BX008]|uniref:Uncharacterized protein n=1 Tax=Amanita muscaria (strain Koide BX008) TaxID=946122 RepID=A0A0C2SPN8_AMAMK|nr:hypothetical protein M378DRAFT_550596 [Amanita muscaria Koide BX008]
MECLYSSALHDRCTHNWFAVGTTTGHHLALQASPACSVPKRRLSVFFGALIWPNRPWGNVVGFILTFRVPGNRSTYTASSFCRHIEQAFGLSELRTGFLVRSKSVGWILHGNAACKS